MIDSFLSIMNRRTAHEKAVAFGNYKDYHVLIK